jgi:hypothetical protein
MYGELLWKCGSRLQSGGQWIVACGSEYEVGMDVPVMSVTMTRTV